MRQVQRLKLRTKLKTLLASLSAACLPRGAVAMRGEFIGVWAETCREIWLPLIERTLGRGRSRPSRGHLLRAVPRPRAGIVPAPFDRRTSPTSSPTLYRAAKHSRRRPRETSPASARSSAFFEAMHDALDEMGGDELSNRYFNLLSDFIDKFSLRYDLRRPCILCPTLPWGICKPCTRPACADPPGSEPRTRS